MNRLENKNVLITGATSGIGKAAALQFAGQGSNLVLFARRTDLLVEVKQLCEANGVTVHTAVCDVRENSSVIAAIAGIPESLQKIDILVNNAGMARGFEPLIAGNPEDWEETLDTNVKGLLFVTREVARQMAERNSGHIINIGSTAGHDVYPNGSVYCASKYAVKAITQALRIEFVAKNIRISTVDPGMVETNFSVVRFSGDKARAENVYKGITPLTPEDVADAIIYVAGRPPHVSINELILTPTAQANSNFVHREN